MQHQLIVLWAAPRSLSTALVRIFAARGDFQILHEPLCDLAAGVKHQIIQQDGQAYGVVESAEQLFASIAKMREQGPVLVKDTCEYDYCAQLDGGAYLRQAQHVFLLRDPAKVINSHFHIRPDLNAADIGYAYLAKLHDLVLAQSVHPPVYFDADELLLAPEGTIARLCEELRIPHIPSALSWQRGHLPVWQRTQHWHQDVANSTRIEQRRKEYAVRVDNDARLHALYQENLPYYIYLQNARQQALHLLRQTAAAS